MTDESKRLRGPRSPIGSPVSAAAKAPEVEDREAPSRKRFATGTSSASPPQAPQELAPTHPTLRPPAPAPPAAQPSQFPTLPCWSIECRGADLTCPAGHRVPGGTRLQLTYSGGTVVPLPGNGVHGLEGEVLSGADWILVRDDGVAVFDARLTLGRSSDDVVIDADDPAIYRFRRGKPSADDDFLVNAIISGVADLKPFDAGFTGTRPVALPVVFEASGKSVSWAKPRFRQLAKNFEKYRAVVESQCLTAGSVTFDQGRVVAVRFDVYALTPAARAIP